jgi:putative ATP-binding cassette transporter
LLSILTKLLNKITQEELELKANYNYALTHIRNHAESIAFFEGENQELNIIQRRFNKLLDSAKRKIDWERGTEIFSRGYQAAIQVFTFVILVLCISMVRALVSDRLGKPV